MLVPRIKSATVLASSLGHRELRRPLDTLGNRQADKAKLKKTVPEALRSTNQKLIEFSTISQST